MAVGRALLSAGENGMTAAEMSFIAQQHQSNLKKAAEELVEGGALRYTKPLSENGRRGRRPNVAFAFAEGEQERFEELIANEVPAGMLGTGTQLVMVDAEEDPERVAEVLSQSDLMGKLAWGAHVDGERPEVWLAYEGHGASSDSRDLMTAFKVAKLAARRSSVAGLMSGRELAHSEERKRQQAERLRARLQTRRPNATGGG
jgi:hypothetical protein